MVRHDEKDAANTRASTRSRLGLARETHRARTENYPHPSIGGTRGFPLWVRSLAMEQYYGTGCYLTAAHRAGCCTRTIRRWEERSIPYRMAGGPQRDSLTGADQLLLTICIFIYPDASSDEIANFIFSNGGDVYSRPQITERCTDLSYTRKRGSRESYDAFSPTSLRRLTWYKTLPPPLGVHAVPIHQLIDIDETGFYLKSCSSKYGRSNKTCRVRYPAHYKRNEPKINVILACESGNQNIPGNVDGSANRPRLWIQVSIDNIDQFVFGGFVNEILTDIEENPVGGGYDDERIFIWDNHRAHQTPYVATIIEDRPSHNHFHSVDRPPYYPKIAPIEYLFCELSAELARRCRREWTMVDLRINIFEICSLLGRNGNLFSTFVHCGYPF